MLAFRRQYSCLQQLSLLDDNYQLHGEKHQVCWYLPDGSEKQQHDWHDPERSACIFQITNKHSNTSLLCIMNASSDALAVTLPQQAWQLLFDTSINKGIAAQSEEKQQHYLQNANSISVWL